MKRLIKSANICAYDIFIHGSNHIISILHNFKKCMWLFSIIIKYWISKICMKKPLKTTLASQSHEQVRKARQGSSVPPSVVPGQNWVRKVNKIFSRVCLLFSVFKRKLRSLQSESVKIQNLNSEKKSIKKSGKSRIFEEEWGVTTFLNGNYSHEFFYRFYAGFLFFCKMKLRRNFEIDLTRSTVFNLTSYFKLSLLIYVPYWFVVGRVLFFFRL